MRARQGLRHKLTDFGREVWKCVSVCVGSKQVEMEIQIEVIILYTNTGLY